jgi:hypothetical protein
LFTSDETSSPLKAQQFIKGLLRYVHRDTVIPIVGTISDDSSVVKALNDNFVGAARGPKHIRIMRVLKEEAEVFEYPGHGEIL